MAEREFTIRLKRPRAAELPPIPEAVRPTEPLPGKDGKDGKDGIIQVVHVGASKGDKGDPGTPGGASFLYTQVSPAATWIITHNLNSPVQITLFDPSNTEIESDITDTSLNVATVTFAQPQAGSALVNA